MSIKFPELTNTQYALARVETNTGHVLDENLQLAINENQIVFTIFEEMDKAVEKAKFIVKENQGIECSIFGKDHNLLQVIQ